MSAYSPAPWRVEDTHPEHCCLYINSSPGVPGDVAVLYGDPTERMADARVVAAAPELLSIAQRISEWERKYPASRIYSESDTRAIAAEMTAIVKDADAAIAKATGGAE